MPTPPTISSPLRKLSKKPEITESILEPEFYNYGGFDYIMALPPHQYLALHHNQADFTCSVEFKNGKKCQNSLYCPIHSFSERSAVQRSASLSDLILQESGEKQRFHKRQILSKLFQNCKSYWQSHPSASQTPKTCSIGSCSGDISFVSSPRPVSNSTNAISRGSSKKKRFPSLKMAYLRNLANPARRSDEDMVSYLFYRLQCYENVDVDVRARELESRYCTEREYNANNMWQDPHSWSSAFIP